MVSDKNWLNHRVAKRSGILRTSAPCLTLCFLLVLNQYKSKTLKMCIVKLHKSVYLKKVIFLWHPFTFHFKGFAAVLLQISNFWARCVIYITLQGWKQKSSERPMTCNLLFGPWHLPLISIFFFSFQLTGYSELHTYVPYIIK